MAKFVKGEIVVLPFPFSNFSSSKKRPALIIATPHGDDRLLAQITSKFNINKYSIEISKDFKKGSLPTDSIVKINKFFSADKEIILYKKGKLNKKKF
ncbi:MAG: type II toxin-antitoxin system PemK/MazF family toxin [Nanoarchaeota archaeon]|jgi:mRNA interferase MazF|nr:type II toxin-antitoxin system PemK/MazF family toxin [Nanoarchaeota archaeon]